MNLDEVLRKTIIEFPKPLSFGEMKELFEFIIEALPAKIRYKGSFHNTLYLDQERGGVVEDLGTSSFTGHIQDVNKDSFDAFETHPDQENSSKIFALRSSTVLNDGLESDPRTIELWDDVRKVVNRYFKEEKDKF